MQGEDKLCDGYHDNENDVLQWIGIYTNIERQVLVSDELIPTTCIIEKME